MAKISAAEWNVMELLWQQPHTLMELVSSLEEHCGWAKSTVSTMLGRMETKNLIRNERNGRARVYHAIVSREEAVAEQTDTLLQRAYHGSVGSLLSAMVQRNDLTQRDIDELYAILQRAEESIK